MAKRPRLFTCLNDPNNFCYICGEYILRKYKTVFLNTLQRKYEEHFGVAAENLEEPWTPSYICKSCKNILYDCASTSNYRPAMIINRPMQWKQPVCHVTDCYFCLSKMRGFGANMEWDYPKNSAVGFTLPVIQRYTAEGNESEVSLSSQESAASSSADILQRGGSQNRLTQEELNDLVRDLELTKDKAELLASRLKERHFLHTDVSTSIYRLRHKPYAKYYTMQTEICFCHDIAGLFRELGQLHNPKDWRLFIDSNKQSLKAVLLHNGNEKPSIPIAHAVNMKESYETMKKLLNCIKYEENNWVVCCDLKVVAILCGLQGGYTKHCCFLCLWDSRAKECHYIRKEWPKRENIVVGEYNIQNTPLVKKENIILPALHIKLGLVKNFIKALDKEGQAFLHLTNLFPFLTQAKIKEGILNGPQIRKLLNDELFEDLLSSDEQKAWRSFRLIVSDFLGNNKNPQYNEIVSDFLKNYSKIGMLR